MACRARGGGRITKRGGASSHSFVRCITCRIMISLALKATKMTVIIILILMGINGAHASSTIEEDADSVRVVERCESIENITVFPGGYENIPNEQVRELILREGGWEDNLTRLMNLVRVTVAHHINTWD